MRKLIPPIAGTVIGVAFTISVDKGWFTSVPDIIVGLLWIIPGLLWVYWLYTHEEVKSRRHLLVTHPIMSLLVFLIVGGVVGVSVGGLGWWTLRMQHEHGKKKDDDRASAQTSPDPEHKTNEILHRAPSPKPAEPSQQKPTTPEIVMAIPVYPVVDFTLAEENVDRSIAIDHVPRLDLVVYNKGRLEIKDVRLRVTEYVLKLNTLRPTTATTRGKYNQDIRSSTRFGEEDNFIKSIAPNGKSPTINLIETKPFQFIKPPNSGEPQSTDEKYYALRFTFDGGAGGTYCSYLVVSRQYPYILPIDQPKTAATVTVDNNFPDMFLGQKTMILDNQRELYRDSPEREYQSGPMQHSR